MTTLPPTEPQKRRLDRRMVALAIAVLIVLAAITAAAVVYVVFFASEAPPAPTLDDALRVLLPSPSA
jgi:hypothetical protein